MQAGMSNRARFAVVLSVGIGGLLGCSEAQRSRASRSDDAVIGTAAQALEAGWTPNNLSPSAWYAAGPADYVPTHDGNNAINGYKWIDRSANHRDATTTSPWSSGWPTLAGSGASAALQFRNGSVLSAPAGSDAPTGTNRDFGVLALIHSLGAQSAAVAAWWDPNGGGFVWAGLKNSNGITLPDLTRTYGLAYGQMFTGPHDVGAGWHVVAWRYTSSTQKMQITVDGATSTSNELAPISDLPSMPFVIGAKSLLPTGVYTGDISELVVVGHAVLDSDVQNYTDYARAAWSGQNIPAQGSNDPCTMADGSAVPDLPLVRCDDTDPSTYGDHCSAGHCAGAAPLNGSPATLSPLAWYHAGNQEVVLTDGGVSTWFDRSSYHADLSQGFYNGRPSEADAGWDGATKPALNFHGGNILKRYGWSGVPAGAGSAFTAYAVVRLSADQNATVISWVNGNDYGRASCQFANGGNGTALDLLRTDELGSNQEFKDTLNPALGTGNHVVVWRYSPEFGKLTVDGRTATVSGPAAVGVIAPTELLVGAANDVAPALFSGYLAEFAVMSGAISDGQVAQLSQYAHDEWGGITLCQASCTGKACGADNGCGGTCACDRCARDSDCNPGFMCSNGTCTDCSQISPNVAGICANLSCSSGPNTSVTGSVEVGGVVVTRSDTTTPQDDGSILTTMTITRGGTTMLQETFTGLSASGTMTIDYGAGFHGISHAEFDTDGTTITGTIDGRAIAPIPNTASTDPSALHFADGSALPTVTTDPGVLDQLSALSNAFASGAPAACGSGPAAPPVVITPLSGAAFVPGHTTTDFPGCSNCLNIAKGVYVGCYTAAVGGCTGLALATGPFAFITGGVCASAAIYACDEVYQASTGTCRDPGHECCPTRCTQGCCGATETCVGAELPALCCDAGLQACHGPQGNNCVDTSKAVCLASGLGCPLGAEVCGSGTAAVCCLGTCDGSQCVLGGSITVSASQTESPSVWEFCSHGTGFTPAGLVKLSFGPLPDQQGGTARPGFVITTTRADSSGDYSMGLELNEVVPPCDNPDQTVTVTALDINSNGTTTTTMPGRYFCNNGGIIDLNGGCTP